MSKYRFPYPVRILCLTLAFSIISQAIVPGIAYALTSGPNQPEFTSFESVNATNMVNEFSGDFTYNIPLLEVPGPQGSSYPVTLSYHSGITPEEEASWVGLGWSLNTGAINRQKKGFADDQKGVEVDYFNSTEKNWTLTAGAGLGNLEIFGFDTDVVSANVSASVRYNNNMGFGFNRGFGLSFGKGVVSLGMQKSNNETSFSANVSPAAYFANKVKLVNKLANGHPIPKALKSYVDRNSKLANAMKVANVSIAGSRYNSFSSGEADMPFSVSPYKGYTANFSVGLEGDFPIVPVGGTVNAFGSYSEQEGIDVTKYSAYGYLYTGNAESETSAHAPALDYGTEKDNPYNKRDVMTGIPFNNADHFVATGEGISGGFRMYHQKVGHFEPRRSSNQMDIFSVGGEFRVGGTIGPGADAGVGSHRLWEEGWSNNMTKFDAVSGADINEKVFMRFNGDLGGSWDYAAADASPIQASISGKQPQLSSSLSTMNGGQRSGRSSFIDFRTNQQIFDAVQANGNKYGAYTLSSHVNSVARRLNTAPASEFKDLIGEIAVVNEAGYQYVYGLPVYGKNESSVAYQIRKAASTDIQQNYLIKVHDQTKKVGQQVVSPYANTYLLTQVNTSDYVDLKLDGPSPDDLGGYTLFNYKQKFGIHSGNLYKWRIPYNGALYSRGSLSSPNDDAGQVSSGQKEIYYLQAIATKSHVAIFTTEAREDGVDAVESESTALTDLAGTNYGNNKLEKLKKIDLYPIEGVEQLTNADGSITYAPKSGVNPVKTVHFDYDNSLTPGVPNNASKTGKLTLTRVYFEYNGISRNTITPYVFEYKYPFEAVSGSNRAVQYPAKYNAIETELRTYLTKEQNPAYSPFNIDGWGNYQQDMIDNVSRYQRLQSWVNQAPPETFDPAAWHLKVIKLPTGGQIHVQYEQDDYAYVQDQVAHVMMPLAQGTAKGSAFYLDHEKLGLTADQLPYLKKMIEDRYKIGGKKIYFKFLYSLLGNNPGIGACNSDYITGYADVETVEIDATSGRVYVILATGKDQKLPWQACEDFVMTQRVGMLTPTGNCDPDNVGIKNNGEVKQLVTQLASLGRALAKPGILCNALNPELSYLRVPMPGNKKGGGVRVKRLLTYDDNYGKRPVLYGYEYHYKKFDPYLGIWRSSGVATNEPAAFREENVLVDIIPRRGQSFGSKLLYGEDREIAEGPVGESIYPGASVGYSQVLTQNIHTAKTNDGFTVKEFYTAKEYPVKASYSDLKTDKNISIPINLGLVNYVTSKIWATQGFNFLLNNMHGQPKRTASYQGLLTAAGHIPEKATLVTEQVYHYYEPGQEIPVAKGFGGVEYKQPGKEVDITLAHRAVKDHLDDVNVEYDLSFAFLFLVIIPYPTLVPSITHSESEFYSHTTSKVVRYPAILKKVVRFQDGIYHTEETLAFDEATGKPIATKSYDEFEGTYISYGHPAGWEYPAMTQKAAYENKTFTSQNLMYGEEGPEKVISFGEGANCAILESLTSGDLLELTINGLRFYFHIDRIDFTYNKLYLLPSQVNPAFAYPLNNSPVTKLTILRSGRTNQLTAQVANTTFHNTDKNYQVPTIDFSKRWQPHSLGTALTIALRGKTGRDFITLSGSYEEVNIGALVNPADLPCEVDISNASIKDIVMEYEQKGDKYDLRLLSFMVYCASTNTWMQVN